MAVERFGQANEPELIQCLLGDGQEPRIQLALEAGLFVRADEKVTSLPVVRPQSPGPVEPFFQRRLPSTSS